MSAKKVNNKKFWQQILDSFNEEMNESRRRISADNLLDRKH